MRLHPNRASDLTALCAISSSELPSQCRNNIAEGFERGTNNELLAFLYIAYDRAEFFKGDVGQLVGKCDSYESLLAVDVGSVRIADSHELETRSSKLETH